MLAQNQNGMPSYISATPQYGGDCALQTKEGLITSARRLEAVTSQLAQITWELRAFFGMDTPSEANCSTSRSAGFKGDIDGMVISANAAMENVNLVLEHLRS